VPTAKGRLGVHWHRAGTLGLHAPLFRVIQERAEDLREYGERDYVVPRLAGLERPLCEQWPRARWDPILPKAQVQSAGASLFE
jgi:hypothetical protein